MSIQIKIEKYCVLNNNPPAMTNLGISREAKFIFIMYKYIKEVLQISIMIINNNKLL